MSRCWLPVTAPLPLYRRPTVVSGSSSLSSLRLFLCGARCGEIAVPCGLARLSKADVRVAVPLARGKHADVHAAYRCVP